MTRFAGGLILLVAVVWSLDLQMKAGALVYGEQLVAVIVGLALFGLYWRVPPILGRAWLNRACAFASLAVMLWIALALPGAAGRHARPPGRGGDAERARARPASSRLPALLGLVDADHLRRASCSTPWSATSSRACSRPRRWPPAGCVSYLALDSSSLLGQTLAIVCTIVLAFMLFGKVLQASGGGDWFTDLSSSLFGHYRGGPGKVEVVASAFFGGISGSAMANVMSTGIITIPNMKKAGYKAETAAAVEAVSSTGGQLVPPVMGAAAFLMAENLQMRYADVALAAILPAALYFFSVFVQVDHEAAARGIGGTPRSELPRFSDVLRRGWFFLVPFIALFALMFGWNMQPEEAVLYSIVILLPFAFFLGYGGRQLNWARLRDAFIDTGRDSFDLIAICAVAAVVIGLLNITGLALSLGFALIKIGQGSMVILLVIVAVICFILGLGLPTTGVYLLVAVLAAPPLIQLGVPPLAAHMFVLYHGCLSMITPPIALAAYAAAHIAGADPMRVSWVACRLGWPAFALPFVFAWSPALLLIGTPAAIGATMVFAVAGVWLGTAAISGFLLKPLSAPRRWMAGAAAALLLCPVGLALHLCGLALGAGLAVLEFRRKEAAA